MLRERVESQLLDKESDLRPFLQDILEKGVNIKRFKGADLPEGVVIDNVRDHTLRLVDMAINLPISSSERDKVKQTVLLHDLPEIYHNLALGRDSDITLVEKEQNPNLEAIVAKAEMETAQAIFTQEELTMYHEFEKAGYLIRSGDKSVHPEIFAILAQTLDRIDGNLILHQYLSAWAHTVPDSLSAHYGIPTLSHTYSYYQKLSENVDNLAPGLSAQIIHQLLEEHFQLILSWWDGLIPVSY